MARPEPNGFWDARAAVDKNGSSVIDPNETSGLKTAYVNRIHHALIGDQLARLPAGASVLDFGCGVGRIARWPEFTRLRYHGVDRSERMVEAARAGTEPEARARREFSVYDGRTLPYADESFELVISVWVLQHILDEANLLSVARELSRVLKPGGAVLLIEQIADTLTPESSPAGEVYKHHRSTAELQRLFERETLLWQRKTPGLVLHGPFYRSLAVWGRVPLPQLRHLVPAFVRLDEYWSRGFERLGLLRPRWRDEGLLLVREPSSG